MCRTVPDMRTAQIALTVAAAGILAVTGCSSDRSSMEEQAKAAGMSDEQFLACEDFANGKDEVSAEDQAGKGEFARAVNEWAQKAGPELADAGDVLARSASGSAEAWTVALDGFAGQCIELGWPTNND
ncbi:lipoprotein [Gordonia phage Santhid]|uniref:Lipoprotein n=1 Tax=Gordonia phage Santhid TaxID=2927281 RepID=A0AAE9GLR9_9CAUD|nr:lipoprotein [Gordonia phage Santhid]UOK18023.1 lipoprotein [Gordonia phage Santhid]